MIDIGGGLTPGVDHALSRLAQGRPLRGIPVALARGLRPADAGLMARLRRAGLDVRDGLDGGPCYVLGAVDEGLSGHLGASTDVSGIAQNLPLVDLADSPLMRLAHDRIGIAQASVMALLDITNLQVAGRSVLVCGHGPVGAGVAAHVAGLGGRVTVVETDALRAAEALASGVSVGRFAEALPRAEVVFVTDGGPDLTLGQVPHLAPGTLLCAAGMRAAISHEIIAHARKLRPVRDHVEAVDLPHAHGLKLVAGGQPLHMAEGRGLPLEARDLVQALHILALAQLLREGGEGGGAAPLDRAAEAGLAEVLVASLGGQLEAAPALKSPGS